jgi:hypothetical protein
MKLIVEALLNGESLGETEVGLPRGSDEFCGFKLALTQNISSHDILNGKIDIHARTENREIKKLSIYQPVLDRLRTESLKREITSLPDDDALSILQSMTGGRSSQWRNRLRSTLAYIKNGNAERLSRPDGESSSFPVPVGTVSPNGNIAVGLSGHLFIYRGSNSLIDQYKTPLEDRIVEDTAKRWLRIFDARRRKAAEIGAEFLQLIIPEKSSMLPKYFPEEIHTPTPIFRNLLQEHSENSAARPYFINILDALQKRGLEEESYRRIDSHFTAAGANAVFVACLEHLQISNPFPKYKTECRLVNGDMAAHFPGTPFAEYVTRPATEALESFERGLKRIKAITAIRGSYVGSRFVWMNETAPIRQKVLVFGNSFFRSDEEAEALSWWFARCFREYHFVWDPTVDFSYVDQVKPDILICQTIERFLPVVPES